MVFTVRLIAASVLCMTVVLAGGLVTACTGAPSATVPTPTGRSIDAPPPPSSTAASSAVATRTAALLPDPRPRLGDETVSEGLRRSTAVLDVEGTGRRPLSMTRMPAGATHLVFAWVCAGGGQLDLVDSAGQKRVIADCSRREEATVGFSADIPGQSARTTRWRVDTGPGTRYRIYVGAY